jgi:hypothetical protein
VDPQPVAVVIVSGTLGAGKTAVTDEMSVLLQEAGMPHAIIDVDHLGNAFPPPPEDPWNERLATANVAALWCNFRDRGVRKLVLARAIRSPDHLEGYRRVIPGARVTVVRLTASPTTIRSRLGEWERGSLREWFLERSDALTAELEAAAVEDFVVSNDDRPVREVAGEILDRLGWI